MEAMFSVYIIFEIASIKQQKKRKSHTSFRGGGGTFSAVSHESRIGRTTAGRKRPGIAHYKVS